MNQKVKASMVLVCLLLILVSAAHAEPLVICGAPESDSRIFALEKWMTEEQKSSVQYRETDWDADELSALKDDDYDVVVLYGGVLRRGAEQGLLQPLDQVLTYAEMQGDSLYTQQAGLSLDGRVYGIPFFYLPGLFSFQQEAAEMASFQLPTYPYTWDELLEACKASDLGWDSTCCLMRDQLSLPAFVMEFMSWQYANQHTLDFQEPDFRQAMLAYAEIVHGGYVIDQASSENKKEIFQRTTSMKDVCWLPMTGNQSCVVVDWYALCIPKKAKHLEAATQYLMDYTAARCQNEIALGDWTRMLLKDATGYQDGVSEYYPDYEEELRQYVLSHSVPRFSEREVLQRILASEVIDTYLAGGMTIDQVLDALQECWNQGIEERSQK